MEEKLIISFLYCSGFLFHFMVQLVWFRQDTKTMLPFVYRHFFILNYILSLAWPLTVWGYIYLAITNKEDK